MIVGGGIWCELKCIFVVFGIMEFVFDCFIESIVDGDINVLLCDDEVVMM